MRFSRLLNSLFLLSLCLPVTAMVLGFGTDQSRSGEKRRLNSLPELPATMDAFINLPTNLKNYFSDNFGFRYELIQLHNSWHINALGTSPSRNVCFGQQGWLYLQSALDSRNKKPLTDSELANWTDVMQRRSDWCQDQGIQFLFVVAPDKASIYPEYLPESQVLQTPSITDQIVQSLAGTSTVDVLDLRAVLLQRKHEGLLYDLTDTHWNDRGAWFAATAITQRLRQHNPNLTTIDASEIRFYEAKRFAGGLAGMLLLNEQFQESAIRCRSVRSATWDKIPALKFDHDRQPQLMLSTQNSQTDLPTVIVFRDSFTTRMVPFLSPVLGDVHYVWETDKLDPPRIEAIKPDIVVFEVVERLMPRRPELSLQLQSTAGIRLQ